MCIAQWRLTKCSRCCIDKQIIPGSHQAREAYMQSQWIAYMAAMIGQPWVSHTLVVVNQWLHKSGVCNRSFGTCILDGAWSEEGGPRLRRAQGKSNREKKKQEGTIESSSWDDHFVPYPWCWATPECTTTTSPQTSTTIVTSLTVRNFSYHVLSSVAKLDAACLHSSYNVLVLNLVKIFWK